jgi:hypothetical protein
MLTSAAPAAAAAGPKDTAAAEAAAVTAALAESLKSPQQQQQVQQHSYNTRMHSHKPDHRPDLQHQSNQQQQQQQQQQQGLILDAGALAEAAAAYSGCLIDTLRHFHPTGTALFADAKHPGRFKQRCLFTVWDPQYTRGDRVDKYGCR